MLREMVNHPVFVPILALLVIDVAVWGVIYALGHPFVWVFLGGIWAFAHLVFFLEVVCGL